MLSLARTTLHADFVKYIASAPLAVKTRTQFVVDVVLFIPLCGFVQRQRRDACGRLRSIVGLSRPVQALYVPNATLYEVRRSGATETAADPAQRCLEHYPHGFKVPRLSALI